MNAISLFMHLVNDLNLKQVREAIRVLLERQDELIISEMNKENEK